MNRAIWNLAWAIGSTLATMSPLAAQPGAAPQAAQEQPMVDAAKTTLANTFASLIEQAVPLDYEKRKDWGRTKNITVGVRNDGWKLYRRKKAVNHGVWKHYRVRLLDPEKSLNVQIENLRAIDGGRVGFTLILSARLDTWARAKVYQYGIHLIALEFVGDADFRLALDCEVGVKLHTKADAPGVAIDPKVVDARLTLSNLNVRRISNADGPIVRELSSGLRRVIEHELKGPKLVAKLNRAIDKRRDRLELGVSDLLDSSWWPLANLPDVQRGMSAQR